MASLPSTHTAFAIHATKAGKAVFAEKPLAVDPAEGEEMVAVAAATGAVNALNFALSDRSAALAVGRALRVGEVASHYLFLTDRLLGPLSPVHTHVAYGEAAEVAAYGLFLAGDVPVSVSGQVAAGPETYEWTLHGSRRSYRITDWGDLWAGDPSGWRRVEPDGPRGSEETRLSGIARAVRGEDPRGPGAAPDESAPAGFAAGLRVQRIVEHFRRETR